MEQDQGMTLGSVPSPQPALITAAIRACMDCALSCTTCADACLSESSPDRLRDCIRLCLDCAEVCVTTASVLTRRTAERRQLQQELLAVCATACRLCGEECQMHADHHDHCRACAEACLACAEACQRALGEVM